MPVESFHKARCILEADRGANDWIIRDRLEGTAIGRIQLRNGEWTSENFPQHTKLWTHNAWYALAFAAGYEHTAVLLDGELKLISKQMASAVLSHRI